MEYECMAVLRDGDSYVYLNFYSAYPPGSNANRLDCIRAMRRQRGYVSAAGHEIVYIE
ncbi:hypothetical protein [Streptococcus mutans]|uniref:hypothetical protein n=1 Tax=Streptococcus mutans TaxID=1309 RepID=UPI001455A86D|nr:hypothetical protein [Streptococcus mutans]